MKKLISRCLLILLVFCALCRVASASPELSLLYTNGGPSLSSENSFILDSNNSIADSFSLSIGATATNVNFYTWSLPNDTPQTVDWSITTQPFSGSTIGSGKANLIYTPIGTDGNFTIGSNLFQLNKPLYLLAGTYYLQLGNATSSSVASLGVNWDMNNGPSSASQSVYGDITSLANYYVDGSNSESFQIYETVPEPSTYLLLGVALSVVAIFRKKAYRNQ